MKKKTGSTLRVEVQFLEFPHNKHESEEVRRLALRVGADRFSVIEDCSTEGWKGYRFRGSEDERRKKGCYYLWAAATINSDGEIGCCDYGEDHGFPGIGLASDYASKNLRNHPAAVGLRSSFRHSSVSLNGVCRHCSLTFRS